MIYSLDLELSSSQYGWVADNADLSITGDITIEAWIKLEQLPSTAGLPFCMVSKYISDTAGRSYRFEINASDKILWAYTSDGEGGTFTYSVSDAVIVDGDDVGVWVHLAGSFDVSGPTATLYKNGSPVADTVTGSANSIKDSTTDFVIGASEEGTAAYFDGKIKDARVWNDIRTGQEIDDNKCVDIANDSQGLTGRWLFENDATDSAKSSDLTLAPADPAPAYSEDVPVCLESQRRIFITHT